MQQLLGGAMRENLNKGRRMVGFLTSQMRRKRHKAERRRKIVQVLHF